MRRTLLSARALERRSIPGSVEVAATVCARMSDHPGWTHLHHHCNIPWHDIPEDIPRYASRVSVHLEIFKVARPQEELPTTLLTPKSQLPVGCCWVLPPRACIYCTHAHEETGPKLYARGRCLKRFLTTQDLIRAVRVRRDDEQLVNRPHGPVRVELGLGRKFASYRWDGRVQLDLWVR